VIGLSLMPIELDEVDLTILRELMEDGRKAFRQIAKAAQVSTPTVESRFRKMLNMELIKKIAPILDPNKIGYGVVATVTLNVEVPRLESILHTLSQREEVRSLYVVAGEANLLLQVFFQNIRELQDFLQTTLGKMEGLTVVSSHVVTRVVKEESSVVIKPRAGLRLSCDYCGREICEKPGVLEVGGGERYFCCKLCLEAYREKYRERIEKISEGSR